MQPARPAIRTACPYCGVGRGVLATPEGAGGCPSRAIPRTPPNYGRLCVKGAALGETVGPRGHLLSPRISGRKASWGDALDPVAQRFAATLAKHGPESVAFYVSGQRLTEDYYAANKLMKGFIGSAKYRHPPAPVRGVPGRGAPPRLRIGHRAGAL